jgi:hypothetical protein
MAARASASALSGFPFCVDVNPATWQRARPKRVAASSDMLLCMRTTIDLNDELLREAKRRAATEGVTLRELIERSLRTLLKTSAPRRSYRLVFKPVRGKPRPGVRLDDRDALFDLMDGR